jgi:FkbM family methyltransferase
MLAGPRKALPARRSARFALLESAFVNWRGPAILGSIAYRLRRAAPVFDALMDVQFDLKTRHGPTVRARLRDVNGPAEVFGLDEYATPWVDWTKVEYIIDAGAHVGGFALWAAAQSECHIVALEPNPATRALLEINVRKQNLDGRIEVRPWALAGRRERRGLRPAADSAATALVDMPASGDVEVEALTLSDLIEATGFPRIDVLKMDIEGAEHEVFAGADENALRSVAAWIIECHPIPGAEIERIAGSLRAAVFELSTVAKPLGQELLIARRSPR